MTIITDHLQERIRQERRWATTAKRAGDARKEIYHITRAEAFHAALRKLDDPLLTAAPDLLAACRVFVSACTIWKDRPDDITLKQAQEMAEKAIEKATK